MDFILYWAISGLLFFVGMGLMILAFILLAVSGLKSDFIWLKRISIPLIIIGTAFGFASSTSFNSSPFLTLGIVTIFCFTGIFYNLKKKTIITKSIQTAGFLIIIIISCWFMVNELQWHLLPDVEFKNCDRIYVIGDSISGGIGEEQKVWPELLEIKTKIPVTNLATPGATVQSALKQFEKIKKLGGLIIIEIGGNDMLQKGSPDKFQKDLELILQKASKDHDVLMFELPLPIFADKFGLAQRTLAKKYNVTMIPKRFFAKVLTNEENVIDGLHLSDKGHMQMARIVQQFIPERK